MFKKIKKNIVMSFLTLAMLLQGTGILTFANTTNNPQTATFTSSSGNAYQDAQAMAAIDPTLKAVENNINESLQGIENGGGNTNLLGPVLSGVVSGASVVSAGNAFRNFWLSKKTDTGSTTKDWKLPKLKPWQWVLVGIFAARELRELFSTTDENNLINNPGFEDTPIGQINGNGDIRVVHVISLFKILSNLADKMGKKMSSAMGLFALILVSLEILILSLKGMLEDQAQFGMSLINTIKNNVVHVIYSVIIIFLLSSRLLWKIYTGVLFGVSMKIGGVLTGQNFTMNDLPNYFSKLMNAPIKMIFQGFRMILNPKILINNYLPILVILSGLILIIMTFKTVVEIMQVLIDYILVGMFGSVTLVFSLFSITKSIGNGLINATLAAMVNVMVLFTAMGLLFNQIDSIGDISNGLSAGKILGQIVLIFVTVLTIKTVKSIGQAIHGGSNGYISGDNLISEVLDSAFTVASGYLMLHAVQKVGKDKLMDTLKSQGKEIVVKKGQEKINKTLNKYGLNGFGKTTKAGIDSLKNGEWQKISDELKRNSRTLSGFKDGAKIIAMGDASADPFNNKRNQKAEHKNAFDENLENEQQANKKKVEDNKRKAQSAVQPKKQGSSNSKSDYKVSTPNNFGNTFNPIEGSNENASNSNDNNETASNSSGSSSYQNEEGSTTTSTEIPERR